MRQLWWIQLDLISWQSRERPALPFAMRFADTHDHIAARSFLQQVDSRAVQRMFWTVDGAAAENSHT